MYTTWIRLTAAATLVLVAQVLVSACGHAYPPAPPMAAASLTLDHPKLPLGAPVEMTYKFVVADAARFTQDYHVLVHFADQRDELLFTDDHDPPIPTSAWKPGQTIEYKRLWFAPVSSYIGTGTIQIGLWAPNQPRVPLAGLDAGQREYVVARFQLVPQTEGVQTAYKDDWHPAEGKDANGAGGWRWTAKSATLTVRNPRRDSVIYLDVDNPSEIFHEPQHVAVSLGGSATIDEFTLTPRLPVLRKIPIAAAAWGAADTVDVRIAVDKTFVPNKLSETARDPRELGIRVFHMVVFPVDYR